MSGRELLEWVAFNNFICPLPDPWRQTGTLAAAFANFSGNVKKSHFPVQPEGFVPLVKRPQPWQVQKAKMEVYAAAHAARKTLREDEEGGR